MTFYFTKQQRHILSKYKYNQENYDPKEQQNKSYTLWYYIPPIKQSSNLACVSTPAKHGYKINTKEKDLYAYEMQNVTCHIYE